ncbi:MAG: 50S ribosomal protein L17 [Deltaproteobacteria bacterium]|nr:50S ribosomal protein L17 [Candidatus Anaeroferrophillacea bacterium]
MRHRVVGRRLGHGPSHQKAMFRSLAGSLIKHETIETTDARAKELRRLVDRLVTMGKRDTLHARRQAFRVLNDHQMVKKLFDEIAPRFANRPGGYTRLIKSHFRSGDNAPMTLVTFSPGGFALKVQPQTASASPAGDLSQTLKQGVEAELEAKSAAPVATAAAGAVPPAGDEIDADKPES